MAVPGKSSFLVNKRPSRDLVSISILVVLEHGEKELAAWIPKFREHRRLEFVSKFVVLFFDIGFALFRGDLCDRLGIGPHVGIERRTITRSAAQDILGLPTSNIELHPIIMSGLPKQTHRSIEMPLLPTFVVRDQSIEQLTKMLWVWVNSIDGKNRVGQPCRVVPRLCSRRIDPIPRVVFSDCPTA